jgi:hypothetical protein
VKGAQLSAVRFEIETGNARRAALATHPPSEESSFNSPNHKKSQRRAVPSLQRKRRGVAAPSPATPAIGQSGRSRPVPKSGRGLDASGFSPSVQRDPSSTRHFTVWKTPDTPAIFIAGLLAPYFCMALESGEANAFGAQGGKAVSVLATQAGAHPPLTLSTGSNLRTFFSHTPLL